MSLLQVAERQIDKKQDLVLSGEGKRVDTDEPFHWILVCDGHGTNVVIDCLRNKIDWLNVVQQPEPGNYIEGALNAELPDVDTYNTGSTFSLARMYKDRVEEITIGDSQIALFLDGEFHHISVEHNTKNEAEMERVRPRLQKSKNIELQTIGVPCGISTATNVVLSCCLFVNTPAKNGWIPRITRLAPTQALGHNGVTGIHPTVTVTPVSENTAVRVVVASDGFWDVHMPEDLAHIGTLSADELAEQAETRWKQQWTFIPDLTKPESVFQTAFAGFDDVSVGVYTASSFV